MGVRRLASKKEKALKAANRFLQKGQVDKAIREYEKILSFDARDPRIRHKYAELLARKGRRDDALEELRWVAEYYQKGGFYPKAIAIFKQMLGLDSDSIEVHLQLGQIYHAQRKVSDATIHFQKAAALVESAGTLQQKLEVHERLYMLSPNDLDAAWRLVSMYTGAAQPHKALELMTRMAERLRTAGELDKLLSVLDRLAGIADEPTAYLKEMAYVLLQRGNPDSAISKLQLCFKKDPQDTETLELLGRAFQEQGEVDKAIQVYEELSRIFVAAGDERSAEIDERIQALHPQEMIVSQEETSEERSEPSSLELPEDLSDEALFHIVRGDAFLRYGLIDKAKSEGNEAVQNWPDLFASHQLRARSLVRLARPDDAADSYMQMYTIAMDRGALPVARECLAATVRLQPGDSGAASRLVAFDDAMGSELDSWTADAMAPGVGALESGVATESAGSLAVDDMGDVLAALDGGGATVSGEDDHGGRSSMLRDEIDVVIDDVFTRSQDAEESVGEVAVGTESMDDEFEELDHGSIESLPEERGIQSGEARSGTAAEEPSLPTSVEESIADEEDEDTAQDANPPDLSGFEQGAEELFEDLGVADHDDFLAVKIPDAVEIRPTTTPDVGSDAESVEEPAAVEEPRPAIEVDLDMELEEEGPTGPTPEVGLDLQDVELSEDEEDDLALEPNPPEDEKSESEDSEDDLDLEPKTGPPLLAVQVEEEDEEEDAEEDEEAERSDIPAEAEQTGPSIELGEEPTSQDELALDDEPSIDEPSFDDDEPTSSDDDLLEDESGDAGSARSVDSAPAGNDIGLDLVLERSLEENDLEFESLLANMADAIEGEYATPHVAEEDAHTRADETDPDLDEIDLALGYYEVGLFEEALREFQSAFDAGVDPARALLYIGRCQRELGNLEEANASIQLALEDTESGDPIHLDLMFEMGLTFEDQFQPALARAMYEQILEIDDSYRGGEVAKRFLALADS